MEAPSLAWAATGRFSPSGESRRVCLHWRAACYSDLSLLGVRLQPRPTKEECNRDHKVVAGSGGLEANVDFGRSFNVCSCPNLGFDKELDELNDHRHNLSIST